jgi:hypothetical protein
MFENYAAKVGKIHDMGKLLSLFLFSRLPVGQDDSCSLAQGPSAIAGSLVEHVVAVAADAASRAGGVALKLLLGQLALAVLTDHHIHLRFTDLRFTI